MASLSLGMKMNITVLVLSQKGTMAGAMMPNLLAAIRKPSAAYGKDCSLSFAIKAVGGRIEEVVQPHYILRTGLL
jgi:hypothetical protein